MRRKMMLWAPVLLITLLWAGTALAKTEIRMVTYGDAFDTYRNIERAFNESHPDYKLVIEAYPYAEYIGKLTVMIASGTPPDVFQTWAQYKPAWAENGFIMDLTDYWAESPVAQDADLYPFVLDSAIYDGKIYGVPYDFNPMAWIVNVNAFDEAGIPIPDENWTIDDFAQYAVKLSDSSIERYGAQLSGHWSISNWQWAVLYTGQDWLSEDRTQVVVDDPRHADMLQFWYDLIYTREAVNERTAVPVLDHWQGGFAMWEGFTGYAFNLNRLATYDWALTTMPHGPASNHSIAQGHMWSMAGNAPNPDKGWVLLEWMLSREGQEAIVKYDNRQPMSPDPDLWGMYFDPLPANKQRMMQSLVMDTLYGQNLIATMDYWPTFPDMDTIMNQHLNTVFIDHEPPANALNRAAREMQALLGN